MPETTSKMSLSAWDQPLDLYNFQQFANNWNKIDFHDHTPGRGVTIPYGGIAVGAVGAAQLASDVSLIPTGGVIMWPAAVAPAGYLLCDGAAYLQSTYLALYGVLGATYHTTAIAGSFNVPLLTLSDPPYGQFCWVIKD